MPQYSCDFLVLGAGSAGLHLALQLAQYGTVIVTSKSNLTESSSYWAQGGIAAVTHNQDSFKQHIQDTLEAGAYHNDQQAVEYLVKKGPEAIERLKELGVDFHEQPRQEGGHSFFRIHHTFDQTGKSIIECLYANAKKHQNITILENCLVLDIAKNIDDDSDCVGAHVFYEQSQQYIQAQYTILATGGLGQLYAYTTNPPVSTGDGIAIASRAGASIADLEFVQFHPTGFLHNDSVPFLLSETLRGAGAHIVNHNGDRFLEKIDPRAELAPRDIVARAIFQQQKSGQVFMDLRHFSKEQCAEEFPYINKKLREYNYVPETDLIPISPAAHYSCGGVSVGLDGLTSVDNLFALGEVACTGVHGANRLASNSLLETLVFAEPIVESITQNFSKTTNSKKVAPYQNSLSIEIDKKTQKQIQSIMWEHVGILRSQKSLKTAESLLHNLQANDIVCVNMKSVALDITKSAQFRTESLGTHWIE